MANTSHLSPPPTSPFLSFNRRFWVFFLLYCALLCGLFALGGFPNPHVDDPAYAGTAEHLARTGQLENPYMRKSMGIVYHPTKYLCQFPAFSYLLAAWMKVAGISVASVLGFFAVANFLTCFCAAWFFQRARFPAAICLFLPWMILSFSLSQGFRPDVVGLCTFWISLICLTYASLPAILAASFFGSMAMLFWPVIIGFVLPVFAVRMVLLWKTFPQAQRLQKSLATFAMLVLGAGVSFFCFLLMIGFDLKWFLHDFLLVAVERRPAGNSILYAFLGLSWTRYNHFFLFCVLMLSAFFAYWSLRKSPVLSPQVRIWLLEITLGIALSTLLYAVNTQLTYFFFWIAAITVAADLARKKAARELYVVGLLSTGLAVQACLDSRKFIPIQAPDTSEIRAVLKKNPKAIIVFDEVAYRYVFDLQPPEGALGWLWLRPPPLTAGLVEDKTPDQIWVTTENKLYFASGKGSEKLILLQ